LLINAYNYLYDLHRGVIILFFQEHMLEKLNSRKS